MDGTLLGRQIDKYIVEKIIGKGGMGTVYLAHHTVLEHPVAIKILRPDVTSNPTLVRRFFLEAKAVAKLRAPGLTHLYDYGHTQDGCAYIAMEYLNGETLRARVKRQGPIDEADMLRLTAQVARTLAAVHKHGVVHRDLKPDNIFVVEDPSGPGGESTKILDFGVAKLTEFNTDDAALTQASELLGTPYYMAPEQWQGANQVDLRADIYSLGCIMYRCLCGRAPFIGDTIGKICAGHLVEEPVPLNSLRPEISQPVNALVLLCLNKAPSKRPATMTDLAERIRTCMREVDTLRQESEPASFSFEATQPVDEVPSSTPKPAPSPGFHPLEATVMLEKADPSRPPSPAEKKTVRLGSYDAAPPPSPSADTNRQSSPSPDIAAERPPPPDLFAPSSPGLDLSAPDLSPSSGYTPSGHDDSRLSQDGIGPIEDETFELPSSYQEGPPSFDERTPYSLSMSLRLLKPLRQWQVRPTHQKRIILAATMVALIGCIAITWIFTGSRNGDAQGEGDEVAAVSQQQTPDAPAASAASSVAEPMPTGEAGRATSEPSAGPSAAPSEVSSAMPAGDASASARPASSGAPTVAKPNNPTKERLYRKMRVGTASEGEMRRLQNICITDKDQPCINMTTKRLFPLTKPNSDVDIYE